MSIGVEVNKKARRNKKRREKVCGIMRCTIAIMIMIVTGYIGIFKLKLGDIMGLVLLGEMTIFWGIGIVIQKGKDKEIRDAKRKASLRAKTIKNSKAA